MSKYQYKVNGVDYQVEIEEIEGNMAKVNVNGKAFEVELATPVKAKLAPAEGEGSRGQRNESAGTTARHHNRPEGECG